MTRGFVLGKFLPPHNGHLYLCDFGAAYCDELTVLVCSLPTEPIPGVLRYAWMRDLLPRCRVRHLAEIVPQEPSESADFWDIWRALAKRFHPEPIDYVFASEAYGPRLASELKARFVPVDPERSVVSVAGREIRRDPFGNWNSIPRTVRPYFVKTVCTFGPESTGKSMLAARLARALGTVHVPEYGRTYTNHFGTTITADDLARIAAGHRAASEAAKHLANRILVLDTDPVLTSVWSQMLFNRRVSIPSASETTADLYILTDIDVPWVDDGTRYFPSAEIRAHFAQLCHEELDSRKLPYVVVSGTCDQRFSQALAAVQRVFGLDLTTCTRN